MLGRLDGVWLDYFKRHTRVTPSYLIAFNLKISQKHLWFKRRESQTLHLWTSKVQQFLLFNTQYYAVSKVLSRYYYTYTASIS